MEDEQPEGVRHRNAAEKGIQNKQGESTNSTLAIFHNVLLSGLLQPASLGFRNTEGEGRNKNSQVPDGDSQTRAMLQ